MAPPPNPTHLHICSRFSGNTGNTLKPFKSSEALFGCHCRPGNWGNLADFASFAECIKNTAYADDTLSNRSSRKVCFRRGRHGQILVKSTTNDIAGNGRAWLCTVSQLLAQTDAPGLPVNSFTDAPTSGPEFAPDPPRLASEYHPRWELTSELVYFLFSRPNPRFPLATTGSATDPVPGAIGQPGTRIIADASTFKENPHVGTKLTATYWLTEEPECLGIELSGFMSEWGPSRFHQNNQGNANDPVLGRPFFNTGLGVEDLDSRAVPGVMAGDVNVGFFTRIMGADASFRYNLTGYSPNGPSLFLLAGPRFVRIDDRYASNETSNDLPIGSGSTFVIQDNFTTRNIFLGGQVGTQFRYRWQGVTVDLLGKISAGNNNETLNINGFTSVTNQTTGQTVSANQGLFAQPSNIGQYTHNTFSVIPEFALKLHLNLTDTIKITLGYGLMEMTHVARTADQLNRNVTIQPLNSPAQVGPASPPRPTTINDSNFWTNYFNLGIELVF